ncbi:MAG: IS110 family transposase [Thiobacillaceae bacterium]
MSVIVPAGIDVSAKSLMVCLLRDDQKAKASKPWPVENSASGHGALIKTFLDQGVTRIVCEATGVYHLELAFALTEAGLPVMVANPRQVKAFIQARLRNTQNDPVDAYELAQFAQRMEFVPWQPPRAAQYALHRIARSLHGYVEQATAVKNRLHAATSVGRTPKIVLRTLRSELACLERLQQQLSAAALKVIARDKPLQRAFDLLISVRGIGQTSAVQILGELCVLAPNLSAKAWVKLAGLDPTRKQSGTSVLTQTRISKRGNAKLRAALYMPAMAARRHDPGLRAFADRLIDNGKTPMQALIAVARKLLHGIHAMFKLDRPWNSQALVPHATSDA